MSDPAPRPGLVACLRADLAALRAVKDDAARGRGAIDALMLPGFWSVALWRVAQSLHARGWRPLSRLAYFTNVVVFGADLAPGATAGPGLVMPHPPGMCIAPGVEFGANCRLMAHVLVGGSGRADLPGHPVIGDGVWLLARSSVFGPVTIGDDVLVGTGAVVTEDVPARMMALATPGPLKIRPRSDRSIDEAP